VRTFIVIGAPRSGTSLVAGILHNNGIKMTPTVISDQRIQPKGYYEDGRFAHINDGFIQTARGSLFDPPKIGLLEANVDDAQRERIINHINTLKTYYGERDWGFKCPRTVIAWPLYEAVWEEFEDSHIIATHRNPWNTAQSIKTSFNIGSLQRTFELVIEYERRIAYIATSHDMLHISFEDWWHPDNSVKQMAQLDLLVGRNLDYSHFDDTMWRA